MFPMGCKEIAIKYNVENENIEEKHRIGLGGLQTELKLMEGQRTEIGKQIRDDVSNELITYKIVASPHSPLPSLVSKNLQKLIFLEWIRILLLLRKLQRRRFERDSISMGAVIRPR